MASLRTEVLIRGTAPSSDVLPIIAEAESVVSKILDEPDRKMKTERLNKIRQGVYDMMVVRDGENPICFIAFEPMDEEVMLRYGHILPDYERENLTILELLIGVVKAQGFKSITSIFNWPQRETFTKAADAIGFARVERVNMVRKQGTIGLRSTPPDGVTITPWSPTHREAAARTLAMSVFPEDKVFHKPYRTLEGCIAYLDAVLNDRYGHFLPDLSSVACIDDRLVGLLLAARLPDGRVDIVDLAVEAMFRGRGIGRSLIGRLIESAASSLEEDIVLTVTRSNAVAFGLYQQLGFKITDNVGYYVYDAEARGQG